MTIELPDFALVVLIGASGSGKSTFAHAHFAPTEVLSSDEFRAAVSDDETDQSATTDAFDALHHLAALRLKRRKLTVIDATNVQEGARKPLLELARRYFAVAVAVVLDVPEAVCAARNDTRENRTFGRHVVARHVKELKRSVKNLKKEGFRYVFHLTGEAQIGATTIVRVPLFPDKRHETGAFDIIGDVHGCYDALLALLTELGYTKDDATGAYRHPDGRRLAFVGDLVDRGANVVEVCRLVMDCVDAGTAFCVPGNHDDKLKRALEGRNVSVGNGLEASLEQINALDDADREAFTTRYIAFVEGLTSHLWLDGGKLAIAHAGVKETMIGRASGVIREFCLYGETTGELTKEGFPARADWAADYRGETFVVYGHTPVDAVRIINNTANVDTGAVFGGALSAIRYPERTITTTKPYGNVATVAQKQSVGAKTEPLPYGKVILPTNIEPVSYGKIILPTNIEPVPYGKVILPTNIEPVPYGKTALPATIEPAPYGKASVPNGKTLDIADCLGRRAINTRLAGNIVVQSGNNAAALEIMSRFAAHPRWLLYLPPTMSPVETSALAGYLEHPAEAFAYFARNDVRTVICEEKHMGSRAVLVVCRDSDVAKRRFGAENDTLPGAIVTRTGRPFTKDAALHSELLTEAAAAMETSGLWDDLATDWVVLDAELMPWNAKAQDLLKTQYAPVAASGIPALQAEIIALEAAAKRGVPEANAALAVTKSRLSDLEAYRVAYGKYCWTTTGLSGLKIAPFHIMAAEGRTFIEQDHPWHIETLAKLADVSPLFQATQTITVDTSDETSVAAGINWWLTRTESGAEGMVVKPLSFLPPKRCQPAIKVRGREYLRIIYGAEYTQTANLTRLKERGLSAKRSLATREFALGIEGLERFVSGDSLRRVHECAFAVLALESEPVDPRL